MQFSLGSCRLLGGGPLSKEEEEGGSGAPWCETSFLMSFWTPLGICGYICLFMSQYALIICCV